MTIRDINRTISTANYATYTIRKYGCDNSRYKELRCDYDKVMIILKG